MYKSITANLMTESVDETVSFYGKLGFTVTASVPGKDGRLQFAILARDGLTLMFQDRESLTGEYPVLGTAKTQPSATLYILVDSVAAYYENMKRDYEILSELHKTFYGATEFAIKDNNGYVLTFTQSY